MVINSINGTSQLVYSNERVRLAIIDTSGHLSWCAYVHRTKTTHQFDTPNKMFDFAEHFNLIPAAEILTREQFRQRITPFVLRMFAERCEPGITFHQARAKMQEKHTLTRGTGIIQESTWTEFDDEASFAIPHGVFLFDSPKPNKKPEFHYPGNGWTYEVLDEILIGLAPIDASEQFSL